MGVVLPVLGPLTVCLHHHCCPLLATIDTSQSLPMCATSLHRGTSDPPPNQPPTSSLPARNVSGFSSSNLAAAKTAATSLVSSGGLLRLLADDRGLSVTAITFMGFTTSG